METLLELKSDGYIRSIGVSNVTLDNLEEYSKYGTIDSDQEKYSIIDKQIELDLLPWCRDNSASMLAYSPLSQGLLSGNIDPERKFTKDDSRILFNPERFNRESILETNLLLEKKLGTVAEKHDATIGNIAIAYLAQDKNVIPICGARNEEQAVENAKAGDIILDQKDIEAVDSFIGEYKY
jgi:aryl-alcohol dehydrogenase-like predicted oxidoreductase